MIHHQHITYFIYARKSTDLEDKQIALGMANQYIKDLGSDVKREADILGLVNQYNKSYTLNTFLRLFKNEF